ncbi:hypothetical protein COV05_00620 [Candidatus Uhrbacteria bacterium CG10_big_fil_rev_8_21_14_0_10_48_16]|uniref:Type II secretion system protein n=1 Tax=Candidatus Uhrbacteria bacterium CG10_big_fil_rev_8_21_14_0_10_48_16 TaxID=1975038 RepID=A0A2M8LI25_9BACT|nr:MAG: hypothetical protein COV05_00620 [Candidatus Uhrbacteria bacterium CG10_big_fil_rev_8_21_14_0_10_48_16]
MKKEQLHSNHNVLQTTAENVVGFSLVEVILSTSIFVLLITALIGSYLYGQESTMLAGNRARATFLAEEGLEAVRNIRDADFINISSGTYGLAISGNQWILSGSSDVNGLFTRTLTITDIDSNRKDVLSTVSWQQNASRSGSVTVATRVTRWQDSAPPVDSCNGYAVQEGYVSGTCRQNTKQCSNNGEDYLPDGDPYCIGGPSADTCCALP